ncbi:hypothetical protein [Actinocorallia populi]|uniref:hypothetical protein n=1 Tax=Actinocorallia populi TaxID=2079200 RepID=UPI000D08F72D|nr:hypothetical protein [Actinocorallia populi]
MPNRPPFTLLLAAALEGLVGLIAVGGGLFTAVETVVGDPRNTTTALAVAAMAIGGGALILKVAHGLYGAASWSRSPAVLTQLFLLPVAVTLVQSDRPQLGYPLVVLAVCALVALFSRPTGLALYGSPEKEEERPD